MPTINLNDLLTETLAGVTIGVLAVPQGLSFASVAGLPPVYGLYNSIAPAVPYFLLGTSPHLVVGPTAVMSLVVRGAVPRTTPLGNPVEEASELWVAYAVGLSFVAGVIQVVLGGLGLGVFLRLVSEPVMAGFVTASALLMMLSQASTLLGVHKCNASDLLGPGHDYDECFLQEYVASLAKQASDIHVNTACMSLAALVALAGFRYLVPASRTVLSRSGPIILVVLLQPVFYGLCQHYGVRVEPDTGREFDAHLGVRLVGKIPGGYPAPNAPLRGVEGSLYSNVMAMLSSSFVIALISFTESMAIGGTVARKTKLGKLDPGRELIAMGASNLACSVTSGYPVTGSFSRTAVNAEAGAKRHQVSSLISAGLIVAVLVALTDAVRYMPRFALAAIVFMSVVSLVDVPEAVFLYRTSRLDFIAFCLVVVVTLVAGIVKGLGAGILVTWIGTLMHTPAPRVSVLRVKGTTGFVDAAVVPASNAAHHGAARDHDDDVEVDVVVMRLRTNLTFSSVEATVAAFEKAVGVFRPQLVVVDMSPVQHVDASGVHALAQLAESSPGLLLLANVSSEARRALQRAKEANAELDAAWALAPIVGGVSSQTRLACFPDVREALAWVTVRGLLRPRLAASPSRETNNNDADDENDEAARRLLRAAALEAWRAGDAAPDPTSCRAPTFARRREFVVVAVDSEWLIYLGRG